MTPSKLLPSLMLGTPPFKVAKKLYRTIARELESVDVELDSLNLQDLAGKDINVFKNVILRVISSEAIEDAIWECATHSTLDHAKITPDLFEVEEKRADYPIVAWEVTRHSLSPFFKNLRSLFVTDKKAPSNGPE